MKTTRTPLGSADRDILAMAPSSSGNEALGTRWWRATRAWPSAERRPSMDTSRVRGVRIRRKEHSRAREDNGCKNIHGSSHLKLDPHGWLLRDMQARLIARTLQVIVDYANARDLFVRCRNYRSRIVNCWERGRLRFRGRCCVPHRAVRVHRPLRHLRFDRTARPHRILGAHDGRQLACMRQRHDADASCHIQRTDADTPAGDGGGGTRGGCPRYRVVHTAEVLFSRTMRGTTPCRRSILAWQC